MFCVAIPKKDIGGLSTGVQVTINGQVRTVFLNGPYLTWTNEYGQQVRPIMSTNEITVGDGVECVTFICGDSEDDQNAVMQLDLHEGCVKTLRVLMEAEVRSMDYAEAIIQVPADFNVHDLDEVLNNYDDWFEWETGEPPGELEVMEFDETSDEAQFRVVCDDAGEWILEELETNSEN